MHPAPVRYEEGRNIRPLTLGIGMSPEDSCILHGMAVRTIEGNGVYLRGGASGLVSLMKGVEVGDVCVCVCGLASSV